MTQSRLSPSSTPSKSKTKIPYKNDEYPQVPYDLVKEVTLAVLGIGALVTILAAVFSTPDVPVLSAKQVAVQDPMLLVQTELNDLGGQSAIATYGPPYNHGTDSVQALGGFSPQTWAGVRIPVNPMMDDVIHPLQLAAKINPGIESDLATWTAATPAQQNSWVQAVQKSLNSAKMVNGEFTVSGSANAYGPVPALTNDYLNLARTGLLEDAIDPRNGSAPILDRTKSLLLFQGEAGHEYAKQLNMLGEQWGIIKETGNFPGAVWLWYYTLLYQIPPFSTSAAGDLLVVLGVLVATGILMFIPFIPGLRSIPKWLGVYRIIWRDYYRDERSAKKGRRA